MAGRRRISWLKRSEEILRFAQNDTGIVSEWTLISLLNLVVGCGILDFIGQLRVGTKSTI
jgi:hypothetical protein